MKIYHYTKEACLEQIIKDGFIKVAVFQTPFPRLVWLTSEQFVPNFCRPQDTTLSPPRFVDVVYHRFIFDSADTEIKKWTYYQRTVKGAKESVRSFNKRAKELKDNPRKWFISEKALPIREHEKATTDPERNFLIDGQSINCFAP